MRSQKMKNWIDSYVTAWPGTCLSLMRSYQSNTYQDLLGDNLLAPQNIPKILKFCDEAEEKDNSNQNKIHTKNPAPKMKLPEQPNRVRTAALLKDDLYLNLLNWYFGTHFCWPAVFTLLVIKMCEHRHQDAGIHKLGESLFGSPDVILSINWLYGNGTSRIKSKKIDFVMSHKRPHFVPGWWIEEVGWLLKLATETTPIEKWYVLERRGWV